jgi:tetratricopeptide (TPR) repeat protein
MIHVLVLLICGPTPADLYNQGNLYYAAKDYHKAIDSYDEALRAGTNARIEYNLGNAYFKSNKMGMAIICYRRARLLSPRDPDINFNLKFSRSFRIDKNLAASGQGQEFFGRLFQFFSLTETSFLAALFFLFSAALISLYIIYRRRLWLWIFIPVMILGLYFFISNRSWISEVDPGHSVITLPEVSARSGPSEDNKEILVIHDGTEIKVRSQRGEYYLIQLPGGMGGWVKKSEVTRVF